MKTYSPKPDHIERRWFVIDGSEQVLGRLASEVAAILRGKHKPIYAPHMDTGDHVIVVNADKVVLTGQKQIKKVAYHHSGYPGGIKETRYDRLMSDRPAFALEKAVKGMLPKNSLGRSMAKKLHVVAGPEHRHTAQQPVPYTLGEPPQWAGLPQRKPPTAPEPAAPASPRRTPRTRPSTTGAVASTRKPAARSAKRSAASSKSSAKSAAKGTAKRTGAKTAKPTATKAARKSVSARRPGRKAASDKEK